MEVYAKQTQTDVVVEDRSSDQEDDSGSPAEPVRPDRHDPDRPSQGPDDQERPVLRSNIELSGEQVDRIVASDDFCSFMDRASRLVERALCEPSDILFDFLRGDSEERGYDVIMTSYSVHGSWKDMPIWWNPSIVDTLGT